MEVPLLNFASGIDQSNTKEYFDCHKFMQLHVGGVLGIIIISGVIKSNFAISNHMWLI